MSWMWLWCGRVDWSAIDSLLCSVIRSRFWFFWTMSTGLQSIPGGPGFFGSRTPAWPPLASRSLHLGHRQEGAAACVRGFRNDQRCKTMRARLDPRQRGRRHWHGERKNAQAAQEHAGYAAWLADGASRESSESFFWSRYKNWSRTFVVDMARLTTLLLRPARGHGFALAPTWRSPGSAPPSVMSSDEQC